MGPKQRDEMVSCKIPRDVGGRIRDVSRVLGQSMGETIERIVTPALPALEKEAMSLFAARTSERAGKVK